MSDEPSPFNGAIRLSPASPEAEQGLLSSCLNDPRNGVALCLTNGISSEHFHIPAHGIIYARLLELWNAGSAVDFITLTAALRTAGELEHVGGAALVTGLFTLMPTAANISHYIDIVQDKFALREIIRVCTEYVGRSHDEQDDPKALTAELHGAVTKLAIRTSKANKSIRQLVIEAEERISERAQGKLPQIRTGIRKLDAESPVRPGDFLLISGRRKSGKSLLAADIIQHVCVRNQKPGATFSLEMPDWQWVERLIANVGRISLTSITRGLLTKEEQLDFGPTLQTIAGSPIEVFDNVYDLPGIAARLRQLKAKHASLAIAVIDYCQLVEVILRKNENREQEVAQVSRTLRLLAGELELAIIGLSQLNETGNTRESRSLENDCTAHWRIIEPLDEHGNPVNGKEEERTIWVPYQRSGAPNIRVRMKFLGAYARFEQNDENGDVTEEFPLNDAKASRKKAAFRI